MSKLIDEAFDLAVKKHGFADLDGNKEAVKSIVNLCIESIIPAINDTSGGRPVVSMMTVQRAIDSLKT